ncbi:hypothetical protein FDP41_004922 [Naegleria fowleri]|uniref:Guanylate cyclase domain-containing protein n=1 Tax=Naegleria fowleri TaxID=5763 RepID=A0A6A5BH68_NAEFO|nr:uncharacterized protein FDP41_004922 [Naegleria fowleri]KAF0976247.1 hypothetical protein FDP41_004922 [Naegleria fowleri]
MTQIHPKRSLDSDPHHQQQQHQSNQSNPLTQNTNPSPPSKSNKAGETNKKLQTTHEKGKASSSSSSTTTTTTKTASFLLKRFEQLPLSIKLFLIVLISMFFLLLFSGVILYYTSSHVQSSSFMIQLSRWNALLNDLIQCTQQERAHSSFILASASSSSLNFTTQNNNNATTTTMDSFNLTTLDPHHGLQVAQSETDQVLKLLLEQKTNVHKSLQETTTAKTSTTTTEPSHPFRILIDRLDNEFLQELKQQREKMLSSLQRSSNEIIDFFSKWNREIMFTMYALSYFIQDPSYLTLHLSFHTLMYMNELLGQEQTIGNQILSSQNKTEDDLLSLRQWIHHFQAQRSLLENNLLTNERIWNVFERDVLHHPVFASCMDMEEHLKNHQVNLSQWTFQEWHTNMTLHMSNLDQVTVWTRTLSEEYLSTLHGRNIGLLILFLSWEMIGAFVVIGFSLACSHSIMKSWQKLSDLVRQQELYKSFIPSHVLLQIEANNNNNNNNDEEDMVEEHRVSQSKEEVKSRASNNTESHTVRSSTDGKHQKYKQDLAARFELYLDRKRVSMLQLKFKGLDEILDFISPNEIVEILKDVFEKVQHATKASHGVLELWKDDSVTIVFNASKDQHRHEQRAIKTCMELNFRLRDLQKSKWLSNVKTQFLILASSHLEFRFAIHSQECLCGNIGSSDLRSFKILGSIYENLSRLISFADQMEVRVVCDENFSKIAQTMFHTRYVGDTEMMEEGNIAQECNIYEIGAPLNVSEDEWLYELANKQKNDEWQDYNAACKEFFAHNYEQALVKFLEHSKKHRNDLATENMIALCRRNSR